MKSLLPALLCAILMKGCATRHGNFFQKANDLMHYYFTPEKKPKIPEKEWHPELEPYVHDFVHDAKIRGVDIKAETLDLLKRFVYVKSFSSGINPPGVVAACIRFYGYETTKVGRKRVLWFNIEVIQGGSNDYAQGNPIFLKELLYHELFHCLMNKGHLPQGVPGIMAPTLTRGSTRVLTDWEGLVDEMFSPEYLELIEDAS